MPEVKKETKDTAAQTSLDKSKETTLIEELAEKVKQLEAKLAVQTQREKVESIRMKVNKIDQKAAEHDMRPVTGVFKNFQSPGVDMVFSRRKYPAPIETKITTYTLKDGQIATLPYYVAESLKQECYYKRNKRFKGTDGVEEIRLAEKTKLFDFFPHTEYIPDTAAENSLVTIEHR